MAETVLVTGANRGIGLELTRQFIAAGAYVIATCRRPENASELHALECDRIQVIGLDMSDGHQVDSVAAKLAGRPVDVLINNAALKGESHATVDDVDYDEWLDVLKVNAIAPFRLTAALRGNLRRSARPRVITISSQWGALQLAGSSFVPYRTSKAAVNKAMQMMAEEFAADGIVVVPVHPGWVSTRMGGEGADLTPAECAASLVELAGSLTAEHSGRFWTWDGREHVW